MTLIKNGLEGGTSGTGVTAANSGGTSGTAFGNVVTNGSSTIQYTNADAAHGSMSLAVGTNGTDTEYVVWVPTNQTSGALRFYIKFASMPTAGNGILMLKNAAGSNTLLTLIITNVKVQLQDLSGSMKWDSGTTLPPTGQWLRVELKATTPSTSTGTLSMDWYTGDGTTAITGLSASLTGLNLGGSGIGQIWIGRPFAAGTFASFKVDDIAYNDGATTYIGPESSAVSATGTAVASSVASASPKSVQHPTRAAVASSTASGSPTSSNTLIKNSAEGGTNGTNVTTGNSGGVSGRGWDAVSAAGSSLIQYSSAFAAHGSMSIKIGTNGTDLEYIQWTPTNQTAGALRFYVYFPSMPTAGNSIMKLMNAGATNTLLQLIVTNTKVQLQDLSGSMKFDSVNVLPPTGQWLRVELKATTPSTTTGTLSMDWFVGDSTTPITGLSTGALTGLNLGGSGIGQVFIGRTFAAGSFASFYVDDVAYNPGGTAYIGPEATAPSVNATGTAAAASTASATPKNRQNPVAHATASSGAAGAPVSILHAHGTTSTATTGAGAAGSTQHPNAAIHVSSTAAATGGKTAQRTSGSAVASSGSSGSPHAKTSTSGRSTASSTASGSGHNAQHAVGVVVVTATPHAVPTANGESVAGAANSVSAVIVGTPHAVQHTRGTSATASTVSMVPASREHATAHATASTTAHGAAGTRDYPSGTVTASTGVTGRVKSAQHTTALVAACTSDAVGVAIIGSRYPIMPARRTLTGTGRNDTLVGSV